MLVVLSDTSLEGRLILPLPTASQRPHAASLQARHVAWKRARYGGQATLRASLRLTTYALCSL